MRGVQGGEAMDKVHDLDVSPFTEAGSSDELNAKQQGAADRMDATFREVGFARIVGHGVPEELIAELRTAAAAFFAKPDEDKMRWHSAVPGKRRPNGSFVPLWSSLQQPGGHDDPLEGYTFHRPHDGWLRLDDPALDHPPHAGAGCWRGRWYFTRQRWCSRPGSPRRRRSREV